MYEVFVEVVEAIIKLIELFRLCNKLTALGVERGVAINSLTLNSK